MHLQQMWQQHEQHQLQLDKSILSVNKNSSKIYFNSLPRHGGVGCTEGHSLVNWLCPVFTFDCIYSTNC